MNRKTRDVLDVAKGECGKEDFQPGRGYHGKRD